MKRDDQKSVGDQGDFVQRLIALKRYEQPDPHFETRNLAALREKLASTAPGGSWADRWLGWLNIGSIPSFRMVLVTSLLALLSVNFLLLDGGSRFAPEHAPLAQDELPATPESALQVASTNDSLDLYRKPVFVFEYPSNRQTIGPVQMAPSSVPVRYDY